MLKFISNLFRKTETTPIALAVRGSSNFSGEAPPLVPTVEIAHLSLAAILAKFPADLRGCVQNLPDESTTVTLPVPTILKQLPSCSVKMSLASLYRQAPPGIFKPGPAEEKRMVEVPLPEIFKRVRPELLKRRQDQRPCEMPEGYDLFGDKENPHAVALTLPEAVVPEDPKPEPIIDFGPEVKLKMPVEEDEPVFQMAPKLTPPLAPPAELSATVAPATALKMSAPTPAPIPAPAAPPAPMASPVPAPAPKLAIAEKPASAPASADRPPLILPIGELAANWPELIRAEVSTMNGATVSLPNADVTAGLAKGRVIFHWGQLRDWITPPPPGASGADHDTELSLPLRVVAPAFLKHSKGNGEARKTADFGEDIPALFHGSDEAPAAQAPAPAPLPAAAEPAPVASSTPAPVAVAAKPAPQPAPVVEVPALAPAAVALSQTLSEVFGQPGKSSWSPSEIVENLTKLPGISGAIVAMQEGFVVAHQLPEPLNGETFAAFIPQIFARMNQYTSEMKLGEVNSVTLHTMGGPCQMFRQGEVLFAALGRHGEPFPQHALNLCAETFKK